MRSSHWIELGVGGWVILAFSPFNVSSQGTEPSDTFRDEGARVLVLRAVEAREEAAEGLESYEARLTERTRVGIGLSTRILTRDRTLYRRERVSRVRWSEGQLGLSRVIHDRRESPSFGDMGLGNGPWGMDFDVEDELSLDDLRGPTLFDPASDRLDLFDAGFIQPVSEEGLATYRFSLGDTLRLALPPPSPSLTIVEVLVEPKERSWEAVEGSLWFDSASGRLVRAVYRPSGVWDHETQQPGDLDDVPGFLLPAIGRVDHIVLDYGFYEERWWLPRRLLGEGIFNWGKGFARMPLTIEWTLDDFEFNEAMSSNVAPTPEVADELMRRSNRSRGVFRFRADVPSDSTVPVPEPLGDGVDHNFPEEELAPLLDRLDQVSQPARPANQLPTRGDVLRALRYNRIQGLLISVPWAYTDGRENRFAGQAGFATHDSEPHLTASVSRRTTWGDLELRGYHRVRDIGDFGDALSIGNSVSGLLFGWDEGDYFRATGGALGLASPDGRIFIETFGERHRNAPLPRRDLLYDPRPTVVSARGWYYGLRGQTQAQRGDDTRAGILSGRVWGEAAFGERDYGRLAIMVSGSRDLLFGSTLGVRLSTGTVMGDPPPQRLFLVGGSHSLRGFPGGAGSGEAFWAARLELANDLPGLRASVFYDLAWAGAREVYRSGAPLGGVGLGVSLVDGLLRADLARGVLRGDRWRAHFYIDGVL